MVSLQAAKLTAPEGESTALAPSSRYAGRLERRMAGEFPILEAFQQFLEAERRRARQHMLMLTAGFVLAMLAIVGLGTVAGFVFYRQLTSNVASMHTDVQVIQSEQGKHKAETAADVRKITASAAALQQQVLGVAAGQRQALDGQAKTIAALKGEVAKLEIKNHALSGDLASMQTVVPSLSSDLGIVVEMLAELKTAQPPPAPQIPLAPQPAPTVMPSVPEIPTTYAALTITVHPSDGGADIPWRVIIPE